VHRRIYFLNKDRSRFISIGYYPDRKYEPYVEIGGVKCGVTLSAYYFTSLVNHLPKLAEKLSKNQAYRCDEKTFHFVYWTENVVSRFNVMVCSYLSEKMTLISYYLIRLYFFINLDAMYLPQSYAAKCTNSSSFVHPGDSVSQYVLYDEISSLVPKM
jgi:hypothetical protein